MSTKLAPTNVPELHLVIKQVRDGDQVYTTVVAGPDDWDTAQQVWNILDRQRAGVTFQGAGGFDQFKTWYCVRSVHDALVQPLLERMSFHRERRLAAAAWGRGNQVLVNGGGWVKLPGSSKSFHGWEDAGPTMNTMRYIGFGINPRNGRMQWVNYGAPLVQHRFEAKI